MPYCLECGRRLPKDASFCPKCGARAERLASATQTEATSKLNAVVAELRYKKLSSEFDMVLGLFLIIFGVLILMRDPGAVVGILLFAFGALVGSVGYVASAYYSWKHYKLMKQIKQSTYVE